jgi:hypothetical protein
MNKKLKVQIQDEDPKFRIEGDNVVWDYKRGTIELTVEALDEIFYQYSKHGLNMSQVQVQNKHGLDALQWQSFKRTFDLVKDSDVFSPYSLSLVSKKEACDMIARKMEEKYSPKNMRAVVEYEDRKQTKKAYEKAIKRVGDLDYRFQMFETALLDSASAIKEVKVRKNPTAVHDYGVHLVADLHGGANCKRSFNQPAYNWNVLQDRMNRVAADINAQGFKKNLIVLDGDFIETFTGLSHANSWKNLTDENGYGVDATVKVTEMLIEWLGTIDNIDEVILISGNHDRVTSSNKEDVTGEVAKLIAMMIRTKFSSAFKVTWEELIARRKIGGVGYLFLHGDKGLAKRKADLIDQYGYKGVFNIAFIAHLHTRKTLADCLTFRIVHIAPIFSGNQYSKGGGWSTLAGYTSAHSVNKAPVVRDFPLP